MLTFGDNNNYQLGCQHIICSSDPQNFQTTSKFPVRKVFGGGYQSFVITTNNEVWGCGL